MTSLKRGQIAALLCAISLLALGCNLQAPASPEATATTFVFPTATEAPQTGSILGRVWADQCDSAAVEESLEGCVDTEAGPVADGILVVSEPGLPELEIRLGEGACPAFGLASASTDADGEYRFDGLEAGTYCVSVDASSSANSNSLLPGQWTFPVSEGAGAVGQQTVNLAEAAVVDGVNFGWDSAEVAAATATPEASATPEVEATPTPEGTPTATLEPDDPRAGLGEPRFNDTFETAENWPLYSNDQVEFSLGEGQLEMKALKADFTDWWVLTWPQAEDFYLEVVGGLKECSGRDEFGLVVRSTKQDEVWVGYLFAVTCDGRYALRSWNGETFDHLVGLTESDLVAAGSEQTHRLGVRAEGTKLELFINGEKLTEVSDDTHESGIFGLFIGSGATEGVEATIDEISLWDLP